VDELLGRLARREDSHRTLLLRIGERAVHKQRPIGVEGIAARTVLGEMRGRLGHHIVGRLRQNGNLIMLARLLPQRSALGYAIRRVDR
jgi:hypothetical protein